MYEGGPLAERTGHVTEAPEVGGSIFQDLKEVWLLQRGEKGILVKYEVREQAEANWTSASAR